MEKWWLGSEDLLRGYDHRLEGSTVLEGTVWYCHQGGWQDHTSQLRVTYRKKNPHNKAACYPTHTYYLPRHGAYQWTHTVRWRWRPWGKQKYLSISYEWYHIEEFAFDKRDRSYHIISESILYLSRRVYSNALIGFYKLTMISYVGMFIVRRAWQ